MINIHSGFLKVGERETQTSRVGAERTEPTIAHHTVFAIVANDSGY
jgi:hypothetical protein